ncbi:hypothetical protein SprV_0401706200 [Sparganum proliferum]
MIHELGATVLVGFSRDSVRSGCFPAGELLHGPDGFAEGGREVKVHVGLHLRQTGDGGVGDGGATLQDAPELLGPSLQNSRLLSKQGGSDGAVRRSGALGCATVDCLDRNKEVLPFVAVRVSLNLLGFASCPGILHLAEPLLHNAATRVEDCFVVISRAIYVNFVQATLLDQQFADGSSPDVADVRDRGQPAQSTGLCPGVDTIGSPRRLQRLEVWLAVEQIHP